MADLPDWLLALLQGQQPQPAGPIAPAGGPPSMSSLMPNPPWAPQGLLAQGPSDAPPAFSYVNPNSPALGGSPEPLDTSYGAPGQPYRLPGAPPSWAGLLPPSSPEPLDTSYGAPGQPYRLPGSPPTWAGQLASMPNLGAVAGSADVPLPPRRPGDLSGFRATADRPQVASEGDVPDTPTPAQPLSLGQAAAGPTSNVYGTPASGASETPSSLGGILGKVGDAIGGIYGAGGPGDALIALGLSNRTGGKSIEALNAAGNQRLNQAKLAAFNLQMQQETQRQNQTYNYFKSKGLSDQDAQAAIFNPELQKNLFQRFAPTDSYRQFTDKDGTVWQENRLTGERKKLDEALKPVLTDVPLGDGTVQKRWVTPGTAVPSPATSGATSTDTADNAAVGVPFNPKDPAEEYTGGLTKALTKTHEGLAGGVEASQGRARDIAAMQGALARIEANGGTTGMGAEEKAKLQSYINTGWNTLGGSGQPFSVDDAQLLSKFNRQLAGGQAKDTAGARVTNFEMKNFLESNAGLALDPNANKRLLGIQSQIENRNIEVGQGIRDMTANALSNGKRVQPTDVEKFIRSYDDNHHITDPITGQDLTKNIKLGDLPKTEGGQPIAGVGANKKLKFNPQTGTIE